MTICLAAICEKGEKVIMASDSMLTSPSLSIEFEIKSPKLEELCENCAIATAGDALVHTELVEETALTVNHMKNPTVTQIVDSIKKSYATLRQRKIVETILQPKGFESMADFYDRQRHILPEIAMTIQRSIDRYDYGIEILIGGVDTRAHIHAVVNPGTSAPFDALGHAAIGSGYPPMLLPASSRMSIIRIFLSVEPYWLHTRLRKSRRKHPELAQI